MHAAPSRSGTRLSRRALLGGLAAASLSRADFVHAEEQRLPYTGVNLAGAEFGPVPGVLDRDYTYPPHTLVDYYAANGFNLIRLPFRWEHLQPSLSSELEPKELARLMRLVAHASDKGLYVALDLHNYAQRRIPDDGWSAAHVVGSDAVPGAALADVWRRLATLCKDRPKVMLGLMNEPTGLSAAQWLPIVNATIAAIRATGAGNLVLVPGVDYTGAHSWLQHSTEMAGVVDPARNLAFEVHQYFDADSSGTSAQAVSPQIGSQRIQRFQQWAREAGFKAFLGEFAAAKDPASLAALDDLCRTLEANSDVWIGWAAWAGGNWWPEDYMFKLDAYKDGRMREQTRVLATYARSA